MGELECLLWLILDDEEAKAKTSVTGEVNATEAIEKLECKMDEKLFEDACEFEPMPAPPNKKDYFPVPGICPEEVVVPSGPSSGSSESSGSSGLSGSSSGSTGSTSTSRKKRSSGKKDEDDDS